MKMFFVCLFLSPSLFGDASETGVRTIDTCNIMPGELLDVADRHVPLAFFFCLGLVA